MKLKWEKTKHKVLRIGKKLDEMSTISVHISGAWDLLKNNGSKLLTSDYKRKMQG